MPNFKALLFLESAIQGWSETYYFAAAGLTQEAVSNVLFGPNNPKAVIPARIKTLPPDVGVLGLRVSAVPVTRSVLLFQPGQTYPQANSGETPGVNQFATQGQYTYPPGWDPTNQTSLNPQAALKIRIADQTGQHRRIFLMRGLPWQIVATDGKYYPGGAPAGTGQGLQPGNQTWNINWTNALDNFLFALISGGNANLINWLTPNPRPNIANFPANILTLAFGPNNEFIVITTDVPILTGAMFNTPVTTSNPNNQVIIRGTTKGYRLNGYWNVARVTPPTAPATSPYTYLLGPKRRNVAIPSVYSGGATAVGLTYQQTGIQSAQPEGAFVVTRRTGKPTGLLVGRRPAR